MVKKEPGLSSNTPNVNFFGSKNLVHERMGGGSLEPPLFSSQNERERQEHPEIRLPFLAVLRTRKYEDGLSCGLHPHY